MEDRERETERKIERWREAERHRETVGDRTDTNRRKQRDIACHISRYRPFSPQPPTHHPHPGLLV